jgi:glyoxylase-like metal-dependent hydrolase (beta-lactamase superfamily II)
MSNEQLFPVPNVGGDKRVHVFRRVFNMIDEMEGMEVDAYIVVSERYVVVLDTMLCPADVAEMMNFVAEELPGRAVLCVDSHADWDHAWGNAYFTGEHAAPIIAHDYCRMRLQSQEEADGLAEFQQSYALFREVRLVPPTITFAHSMTIHGGDLTIELKAAPGHHPDQIVAWIPELRLLLAFDAVEKPLPLMDDQRCVPDMFITLERLLALQPERVLCSHGKSTSPQLVADNLHYVREIEHRSRLLLQKQRPSKEELEHASALIDYSFDEVTAGVDGQIDRTFYEQGHENNIRAVLRWLMEM